MKQFFIEAFIFLFTDAEGTGRQFVVPFIRIIGFTDGLQEPVKGRMVPLLIRNVLL